MQYAENELQGYALKDYLHLSIYLSMKMISFPIHIIPQFEMMKAEKILVVVDSCDRLTANH